MCVLEVAVREKVAEVEWSAVGDNEAVDAKSIASPVANVPERHAVWRLRDVQLPKTLEFKGRGILGMELDVQKHLVA